MSDPYFCDGYYAAHHGYVVRKKADVFCRIASFVSKEDAMDYATYRNAMLKKYNTTDVTKYHHGETP